MVGYIYIIDDDEAVRDSTRALLECVGYHVRAFESSEAFLKALPMDGVCLLVDQYMPGLSGLDLVRNLYARGIRTPAIVITGRNDPNIERRAAACGARVLEKPISDEQLLFSIKFLGNQSG